MMYAEKLTFTLYCSNHGIDSLCQSVFESILNRDFRSVASVTSDYLKYVTSLAYFYRCSRVAELTGYHTQVEDLSDLRRVTCGLRLPGVLCDYIESLGRIQTASGAYVGPWVATATTWYAQPFMWSPNNFLHRIPDAVGNGPWSICPSVINMWNDATTRAAARSMHVRTVSFDSIEGDLGMLISCHDLIGNMLTPVSSQVLTNTVATKHGCYQWRNSEQIAEWPGDTSLFCAPLFRGYAIDPLLSWKDIVVGSFVDPTM